MSSYGNYKDAFDDFREAELQLTEWDVEQLERLAAGGNPNAGQIVENKTGLLGRTYSKDSLVNGKVQVHCDNGAKMLCDPSTLKLKGYID